MTHVGLSIVLSPLTGAAIMRLALSYGRAVGGWRLLVAGVGVLAGLAVATAVPLSILLPDNEITPVFAAAGILTARWSLGTAAGGARTSPARVCRATAGSDRRTVGELVG
jgi:hypothetical protein